MQRRLDEANIDELNAELLSLSSQLRERSEQLAASQKSLATSSDELKLQKSDNFALSSELRQTQEQLQLFEQDLSQATEGWEGTKRLLTDTQEEVVSLQKSLGEEKEQFKALHGRFDEQQHHHQELQVCLACATGCLRPL